MLILLTFTFCALAEKIVIRIAVGTDGKAITATKKADRSL